MSSRATTFAGARRGNRDSHPCTTPRMIGHSTVRASHTVGIPLLGAAASLAAPGLCRHDTSVGQATRHETIAQLFWFGSSLSFRFGQVGTRLCVGKVPSSIKGTCSFGICLGHVFVLLKTFPPRHRCVGNIGEDAVRIDRRHEV